MIQAIVNNLQILVPLEGKHLGADFAENGPASIVSL